MKTLLNIVGRVLFWVAWPLWFVYLRLGRRTRIVVEHNGKILLVKGWLGAGKWSLPGGGIKRNENPIKCALRELKEETAVSLNPADIKHIGTGHQGQYGLGFDYEMFGARLSQQQNIKPRIIEIADIAWVPIDKLSVHNCEQNVIDTLAAWRQNRGLLQ